MDGDKAFVKANDPERFWKSIPRDLGANLAFRSELHGYLDHDRRAQDVFLEWCEAKPHIAFDTAFFTLNPRESAGRRNWPFILRAPRQIEVVRMLHDGVHRGFNIGIEKSRSEGATELVMKYFTLNVLIEPYSQFLVGSRTENEVDRSGDNYTLMAKFDHTVKCLPEWWKRQLGGPDTPAIERTHLHIRHKEIEACIDGEATSINFGASSRATAILLDEFGRIDSVTARSIEGSVHDVANCVIYSSTHWLGAGHPFAKALAKRTTKVVQMPWYDNPEKNAGLYRTPDVDVVEIVDIGFYRDRAPEIFSDIKANEPFSARKFEERLRKFPRSVQEKVVAFRTIEDFQLQTTFVADGGTRLPPGSIPVRCPWHDYEEIDRDPRDFASNVWMSPGGSSDSVFPHEILLRIKTEQVRPPDMAGEVEFGYDSTGRIKNPRFHKNCKGNRFKLWCRLKSGRPDQTHNYIISCDPSMGTGASNSVAQIYDCNTQEQIGEWVCPNTPPELFADQVVALAKWCGGVVDTFLIWENNGGHGVNFGRRIVEHNGYRRVYVSRTESKRHRRKIDMYGWHSGKGPKFDVLSAMAIAVSEGVRKSGTRTTLIIHSAEMLDEMSDYIFEASGSITASERADDTSGARERHGDRVLSMALALLATKDQAKAAFTDRINAPENTFAARKRRREQEKAEQKQTMRQYFY